MQKRGKESLKLPFPALIIVGGYESVATMSSRCNCEAFYDQCGQIGL